MREKVTVAWRMTCDCPMAKPIPCTVLDPFGGAGTTGMVADRAGRNAALIELNPEYVAMATRRLQGDGGLFAQVDASPLNHASLEQVS
jgi:DNA modification methylase